VISVRVRTIGLLKSLIRQGELGVELPDGEGYVLDSLSALPYLS